MVKGRRGNAVPKPPPRGRFTRPDGDAYINVPDPDAASCRVQRRVVSMFSEPLGYRDGLRGDSS